MWISLAPVIPVMGYQVALAIIHGKNITEVVGTYVQS